MKWKILKECNRYEISDNGDIRLISTGKYRTPTVNNRGYYVLSFRLDDGSRKMYQLHRLVASNFLRAPSKKIREAYTNMKSQIVQVDHINRNRLDNNVKNLRWCTPKQNLDNADVHNKKKGSEHIFSKVTQEQLDELTSAYYNGTLDTKEFAVRFGVDLSTINKYLRNAGIRQRAKRK